MRPPETMFATPAPQMRKAPYIPCFPTGAFSTTIVAAPPISPPTKNPWSMRQNSSSRGAMIPMVLSEGMRPMPVVASPMPTTVIMSTVLRPARSPTMPQMTPPTGRRKNPTAKVANEESCATTGSSPEKNTTGNTAADARPYR